MYRYDEIDQRIVDERVAQFRDQTRRFLDGKLSEDEFRPLRLRNGLYIQRYAPMLRVAIPYGLLSSRQLRMLAHIARKYDRGYGHFTTRQNIQYNWPQARRRARHARRTRRRRDARHPDLRQLHPQHHHRPLRRRRARRDRRPVRAARSSASGRRCIPNSPSCRASSRSPSPAAAQTAPPPTCTTSACTCVRDAPGNVGFRVLVGGGLGRTPIVGQVISEFLPRSTCSPTSRRSCASTTATAAATTCTRRASRSW